MVGQFAMPAPVNLFQHYSVYRNQIPCCMRKFERPLVVKFRLSDECPSADNLLRGVVMGFIHIINPFTKCGRDRSYRFPLWDDCGTYLTASLCNNRTNDHRTANTPNTSILRARCINNTYQEAGGRLNLPTGEYLLLPSEVYCPAR